MAHEEGDLHSFAAILGNDVAIKAYRDRKLPFPDGTIIAALHYSHVSSEENNKVFGVPNRSFPGHPPTFSLWSRIQKNTPRRAAGDTHTSIKTVNRAPRRHSKPAPPATRKLLATPSSRNMRPNQNLTQNVWTEARADGYATSYDTICSQQARRKNY